MAEVIDTIERDGIKVLVYDDGMERNAENGRIIKASGKFAITAEKSHVYLRRRQEKQARLLREAIVTETMDKLDVPRTGSAQAVAAAGGILWREVVLDKEAYPRDRMEAWEKLGKYAQVLPSDIRDQSDNSALNAITATANAHITDTLARLWREVLAVIPSQIHETIDGQEVE